MTTRLWSLLAIATTLLILVPSRVACGPPTILTHPECAMLLEPLARCAVDQESHAPCCAMTAIFTQSGCYCEDNCRDPQGNIDMQLQHLVMRELGLHTLVQFCESDAQENSNRFFERGVEWFAQAVGAIQNQPINSDMLLHGGSLPVAPTYKDSVDSYRQAVAAAESRLKASSAHKLAAAVDAAQHAVQNEHIAKATQQAATQQAMADAHPLILDVTDEQEMVVYSDGMPYEHADKALLSAAFHRLMPSDSLDAYYDYTSQEEDNNAADTAMLPAYFADYAKDEEDDNAQHELFELVVDAENQVDSQYVDYTMSSWLDMVTGKRTLLPCLSDVVNQLGSFFTAPFAAVDKSASYGPSRRAGPREGPWEDVPPRAQPTQRPTPAWDALAFTSDVLDDMRSRYLAATAEAMLEEMMAHGGDESRPHSKAMHMVGGIQSATPNAHEQARLAFLELAPDSPDALTMYGEHTADAISVQEYNDATGASTPASADMLGVGVHGDVGGGVGLAPAVLGWEAVDKQRRGEDAQEQEGDSMSLAAMAEVGRDLRDQVVVNEHGLLFEPVWEMAGEGAVEEGVPGSQRAAARAVMQARMAAYQATHNKVNAAWWQQLLQAANDHYWSVLLALSTLNMLCFAALMGRLWWLEQRCQDGGESPMASALSTPTAATLTTNPLLERADVTAFVEEMARALEASPACALEASPACAQVPVDDKRLPLLQNRIGQ